MKREHHLTQLRWEWQKIQRDESLTDVERNHAIKKLMNTVEMVFRVPNSNKFEFDAFEWDVLGFYSELAGNRQAL